MRILHFCESLSRGGGISSFISNLVEKQIGAHDVVVAVVNVEPNHNNVDIPKEATIKVLGKTKQGFSIKYPFLICNFIRKSKFDIVHIHSSFLYYALSIILLHKSIKFVYTVHSDAVKENASKWDRYFLWLKRFCFRRGWLCPVTISKKSKLSFDELYGMDSTLIVNGVKRAINATNRGQLGRYRYTDGTKIFYHPGRITEAKNQVVLCEAFSRLISEGRDVVLLISGIKQDAKIFSQLENYFSDRIIYLGERDDVLELLCEVDAMCMPSKWEGMPMVLLEALSVGCVPICAPVGGIPEAIMDGKNGLLSNTSELNDYMDALHRFLSMNEEEVSLMREQIYKSFDRFSIENTYEAYNNCYYLLREK